MSLGNTEFEHILQKMAYEELNQKDNQKSTLLTPNGCSLCAPWTLLFTNSLH